LCYKGKTKIKDIYGSMTKSMMNSTHAYPLGVLLVTYKRVIVLNFAKSIQ